ncbi:MAG TPA: HAD hydrolase-like protein [Xanthobacteraceae bacterium]|jgi:phosphoglycolate phosphatase
MTRTIVFDLDGTLVDTAPDLIDSLNVLFAREGLAPIAMEQGRVMIGGGVKRLIERALSLQGRVFKPTDVDDLFGDYVAYYAEHIADRSRPFAGVEAALDALARRGDRFAVCTNKLAWLSVRLLDALGLSARFATICGQDTFGIQKPDPEVLRRTVLAAGGTLASSLMVGDSAADIMVARAAGVPVVAVDFGYTEVPVAALKPDRIISHFDALPDAVAALMGGGA